MRFSILVCLFLFTVSVSAGVMPDEFEEIRLNMDWKEVLKIRPNAKLLNLGADLIDIVPDPNAPKNALTETVNSGPIDRVVFGFKEGRLTSCSFFLSQSPGGWESLLQGYASKFGDIAQVTPAPDLMSALVSWNLSGMRITLALPLHENKSATFVANLQIMDSSTAKELDYHLDKLLEKKTIDEPALRSFKAKISALCDTMPQKETSAPATQHQPSVVESTTPPESASEANETLTVQQQFIAKPSPPMGETNSSPGAWTIGAILLLVFAGGFLLKLRRK
jgi:hypothetical protein